MYAADIVTDGRVAEEGVKGVTRATRECRLAICSAEFDGTDHALMEERGILFYFISREPSCSSFFCLVGVSLLAYKENAKPFNHKIRLLARLAPNARLPCCNQKQVFPNECSLRYERHRTIGSIESAKKRTEDAPSSLAANGPHSNDTGKTWRIR